MEGLRFGYYFLSFCSLIKLINCACTFPSELTDTWYSSHKGNVQFNSTHLNGYSIYMSATVSSLDFQCEEKDGDVYMLKATEAVFAFGNWIDSYLCIELHRVSEYKYYYYLATNLAATNGDYIYGRSVGTAVTMSLACNRQTPYEAGTFITLVKDGAVIGGFADATCPSSLLAYYYNVTITNSAGTSSCTGSIVDGCSTSSTLQYTYNGCVTSLKFSTDGMFFCLHSITSNGIIYTSVWNNDTTVDGTSTFRCTCYASSTSGETLYATEFPKFCSDTSQTSTSVPSTGLKMIMTASNSTCITTAEGGGYGGWIALIILLSLGAIAVAAMIIIIYIRYKKNKGNVLPRLQIFQSCLAEDGESKASKNTVHPSDGTKENPALMDPEDLKTSARLPPITPKGEEEGTEATIQPKIPPIKPVTNAKKK